MDFVGYLLRNDCSGGQVSQSTRAWTDADQALLYTCHLASDRLAGRAMRPAPVHTPFPPQFAAQEQYLAAADFALSIFDAPGDGTYQHNSSFFFATGRAGLAMTAGLAATRAVGNSRRKKQAVQNAIPRWLPRYSGIITVSDHGVYLRTPQDFIPWNWALLQSCEVIGFNQVIVAAPTADGRLAHWLLQSPFAELTFVLWATARYPAHPQLADNSWLPQNWAAWARDQGRPPALEA